MEQTLLSRKELAERWGLAPKTIEKYEIDGVINRVKDIPTPRYSIESIKKLEGSKEFNPMSPEERIYLEKQIKDLKIKVVRQQEIIQKIASLGAESLKLLSK